jgi:hypothetical protein
LETANKGTLRGFFSANIPFRMRLHGLMFHEKDGARWIGFPAKDYTDSQGQRQFAPELPETGRLMVCGSRHLVAVINGRTHDITIHPTAALAACTDSGPNQTNYFQISKKEKTQMPFIVQKTDDYIPAPEGSFSGVVCDIQDLGEVDTAFGTKHKCRVSFQLDEQTPKGGRFVAPRAYTVSLHRASALTALLTTLLPDFRGERVDLEDLIGLPCLVSVEHNVAPDGKVYANVATVAKLPRGMRPIVVEGYIRQKGRDSKGNGSPAPAKRQTAPVVEMRRPAHPVVAEQGTEGVSDDDLPF